MGSLARALIAALAATLVGVAPARADTGSWTPAAPMPAPRELAAAATMSDGRVLVLGGDAGGPATWANYLYDPTANSWTTAASPPSPRIAGAAAPIAGDRVLVVGGTTPGAVTGPGPEIYDGRTNAWSPARPTLDGLVPTAATTLSDGRVLVTDGFGAQLYDPTTGTWAWTTAPGPELEQGAVLTSLPGDQAVMPGGVGSGTSPQVYDAATASWFFTTPADWQAGFNGPAATLSDGHAVLLGPAGLPVVAYDPAAFGWARLAPLPAGRNSAILAALPGDRLLVAGGVSNTGGGVLASTEIFTAPATYPAVWPTTELQIDGAPIPGETMTATAGTNGPYIVQWSRCPNSGWSCQAITPPSAPTNAPSRYVVTSADIGSRLEISLEAEGQNGLLDYGSTMTATVQTPAIRLDQPAAVLTPNRPGTVTVDRNATAQPALVGYRIAPSPYLFTPADAAPPVTGVVRFAPGQATQTINVTGSLAGSPPGFDHGLPLLERALTVQLFDPVGLQLGSPSTETVGLCSAWFACDPLTARDAVNPLGLPTLPPVSDPLRGAGFFVDGIHGAAAKVAAALRATDLVDAKLLAKIALEPNTTRFGKWNGAYPGSAVRTFLSRVATEEPGDVPMLSTYRIVAGHCGRASDTPAEAAAYHAWITSFAEGIGNSSAVLFLEMDSLITEACLSKHGLDVRLAELRDAVGALSGDPHLVVYLDAGAADALPARVAARLLREAGVAQVRGFFLNSTHFDWTRKEIAYGDRISRLLGGVHFVVNTAENGAGPLVPRNRAKQGNEVLCNPPGRGLGPRPTSNTGFRLVDAFAWIANPGVSGGPCRPGAPTTGRFWPALALDLARHADFAVR